MNKMFTVKKRNVLLGLLTAVFVGCIVGVFVDRAPYTTSAETQTKSSIAAPAEGKNIKSVSVTLSEDIAIKYYVNVSAGYGEPTAKFNFRETEYSETAGTLVSEASDAADAVYQFTFDGVTPQYLGVPVNMTVAAAKTGETAEEEIASVTNYSVRTYCEKLLEKTPEDFGYTQEKYDSLRSLAVDLLNYGAASQTYMDAEGELVNVGLTAGEKALATGFEAPNVGSVRFGEEVSDQRAVWKSAGLLCDSKIAMYFKATATVLDGSSYTLKIGNTQLQAEKSEPIEGTNQTVYTYYYTGISLTQFEQEYTAQLFDGSTPISNTITYSVNHYIANTYNDTNEKNAALVKAIYSYGKAAVAYKNAGSLEYAVVSAPTENDEGVLEATYGGYTYTKKIPSLSADFEDGFAYYQYDGTSLSENGAVGSFRLKSESGYGAQSFNAALNSYIVTVVQDGGDGLPVFHSVYDVSRLNPRLVGSIEAGISVVTLTDNVTLDNMSLQGKSWTIDSEIAAENEGYTLTVNNSWELKADTTIGANATVKPVSAGNGINLYANRLTIDGKLISETMENEQWQSGLLYCADNVSVTVNGTFISVNKGIGVYMNNANDSFTVNGGATVGVETTYGHAFVGNGADNTLTIKGGVTFTAKDAGANAVLCQNDSLEIKIEGGSFTASGNVGANTVRVSGGEMNLQSETATYNLRKFSLTGGSAILNNTLINEKTVVKGGTLTVNTKNAAAIICAESWKSCRYYFLGGETTLTCANTIETPVAVFYLHGWDANGAIAIGGDAKVNAVGFDRDCDVFGLAFSTYLFTKYDASNGTGFCYKNSAEAEASPLSDFNAFDFWGKISTATYWAGAGITVNGIDEISGKPISAENVAGEVDFENL